MLALSLAVMYASPAAGNDNLLTVTTLADAIAPFDGSCSLREALINANGNMQVSVAPGECPIGSGSATDTIVLQSGQTYLLTLEGDGDFAGDLDIGNDPALAPEEVDLRIMASGTDPAAIRQTVGGERVVQVVKAAVDMTSLDLQGGEVVGEPGGGLFFDGTSLLLDRVSLAGNSASGLGGGLAHTGDSATLIDSRILYNSSNSGGGIFSSGPITLRRTVVYGNAASSGGGIYAESSLRVEDASIIALNEADGDGGGISVFANPVDAWIEDSTLEGNTAPIGAGMSANDFGANAASRLTLVDTVFADNHATTWGGALFSTSDTDISGGQYTDNTAVVGGAIHMPSKGLNVSAAAFVGNKADNLSGRGGAIFFEGTGLAANDSTFELNSASQGGAIHASVHVSIQRGRFTSNNAGEGGAIHLGGSDEMANVLSRSVFNENTADSDGGAIWTNAPSLTIANTTISGNSVAMGTGSALFVGAAATTAATNVTFAANAPGVSIAKFGALEMKNSIVQAPGNINCQATQDLPFIVSLGNNLSDDASCVGLDGPGDQSNVDGLLAPLADNGGNTLTHALLEGSPAIDAGDGVTCDADPVGGVDQRGMSRNAGLNCDIGAYEKAVVLEPELFRDGFESP